MAYSDVGFLQNIGVPDFAEVHRNFAVFDRRNGELPEQREGETLDYRSLLHRDGSVITPIKPEDLAKPEVGFLASRRHYLFPVT